MSTNLSLYLLVGAHLRVVGGQPLQNVLTVNHVEFGKVLHDPLTPPQSEPPSFQQSHVVLSGANKAPEATACSRASALSFDALMRSPSRF